MEKKLQNLTGLQLPNYLTKLNLLIRICQHLLIVIIVIQIWYIPTYKTFSSSPTILSSSFTSISSLDSLYLFLFPSKFLFRFLIFSTAVQIFSFSVSFNSKPYLNCQVVSYLATIIKIKHKGIQGGIIWWTIGTIKLECNIFIAKMSLKFVSNLLDPLKLNAPCMVLSKCNVFKTGHIFC